MKGGLIRKTICLMLAAAFVLCVSSCQLNSGKSYLQPLEYTEFPSKPYDIDKVHPVRKPGKLSGDAASNELNAIEWDYIRHDIGDDYRRANWSFNDLSAVGIKIGKPGFGKAGPGDLKSECEYLSGLLERLYKIDFEKLDKQDRDFYDQIVFDLEEERYIKQYEGYAYMLPAIEQESIGSLYTTLSYLDVRNKTEAEMFIELLKDADRFFDEICEFEEKRSEKGYASIAEFYTKSSTAYAMLTQKSRLEPFRATMAEKIEAVQDMTSEEKTAFLHDLDKVIEEVLNPEFLECSRRYSALAKTTKNTKGLAGLDHGKEMYEYLLRKQIGKDCNVAELGKELDKILSMPPAPVIPSPAGDNNREKLENIEKKIAGYFPELKISYEIAKLPESFKAAKVGGVYAAKHYDDPSHEVIFLPDFMRNEMVIFHEGIPGHMYQFNYHKTRLRHMYYLAFYKNTYVEGWATYIMDNPASMYGVKGAPDLTYNGSWCTYYMVQARADILINYEGYSDGEASKYLSELTKNNVSILGDEIMMTPAIAISYGLGGYMTLKTLEAIKSLDPEMSILTMHTLYLDAGPGCFDRILESVKRQYKK
ncbi:MAG: DUF885 domain-containing protein [Ruminococcaceae bacterium]|nr:DUF885 domain-containing protein [Oscillospiraceae bacterium]